MTQDGGNPPRQRKERKENADRRRRQLIEATLKSVVENGLAKTTLATVAREANLSQGVAVFYFESKEKLLAAALEHQYGVYENSWRTALAEAGDDPADQLKALVRADLSPENCSRDALAVWFSFWGEASFRPHYAETAREFDKAKDAVLTDLCARLLPDASEATVRDIAYGIDSMTDGFWQRFYVTPESFSDAEALRLIMAHLRIVFPDSAERFVD